MINFELDTPIADFQDYLNKKNWLRPREEVLKSEKPGEGNMNVVIRLITNQRSLILKQSRPFVQKYQQISAPLERIAVEFEFYKASTKPDISSHLPKILGYEAKDHLLLMQDLGQVKDMTWLYESRQIQQPLIATLIKVIRQIHNTEKPENFPLNTELRQLNHQHIFVLPFMEDNGFQLDDIQPGLQQLSKTYKTDKALKEIVDTVGNIYLSPGDQLIHGDYYPGSWMTMGKSVYVIDPEFSFIGFAEFDLGVMMAHLFMATMDFAKLDYILDEYGKDIDVSLVNKVIGIEIIRRLIGLAQLPLNRSIEEKTFLLQRARNLILK